MKIFFGINKRLLEAAGYTKVFSHTYAKQKEQEWITNSSWHKNKFPRFHITKENGQWNIHYDFFERNGDYHISDIKSQIVRNERERIKKLSVKLYHDKLNENRTTI